MAPCCLRQQRHGPALRSLRRFRHYSLIKQGLLEVLKIILGLTILNAQVFAALKRGGIYLIIDHAAPAGSGMADTETLHRIDPAIVKAQVEKAGFRFVGESTLLRNPADDHTKFVFDKSIIGRTDQFIYRFRKP
jgi:predicted methyltransferase